jgi:hypothetical protein
MIDFKCRCLKMYAVLQLNCISLYYVLIVGEISFGQSSSSPFHPQINLFLLGSTLNYVCI